MVALGERGLGPNRWKRKRSKDLLCLLFLTRRSLFVAVAFGLALRCPSMPGAATRDHEWAANWLRVDFGAQTRKTKRDRRSKIRSRSYEIAVNNNNNTHRCKYKYHLKEATVLLE